MDDPAPAAEDDDVIFVESARRRGVTLSDIEPEVTLDESDIAAYGVSSLSELLEELAPESSSGRGRRGGGRPVVLLNGRRISGFREIGRYPPEALARVEVLPEEAALSYGFAADQRVINFVLKPNVVVRAAEAEHEVPDQGGTSTTELSFQRLTVNDDKRFSIDLSYETDAQLLESERDFTAEASALPFGSPANLGADNFGDPIGSLIGGNPGFTVAALQADSFTAPIVGARNFGNEQPFRTLRPERETWQAGFSRSQNFVAKSVLTLSGQYELGETERLLGLADVALDLPDTNSFVPFGDGLTLYAELPQAKALRQDTETESGNIGLTVVSKPGRTNWTFSASYDRNDSETLTDLAVDAEPLQARIDAGEDPFAVIAGPFDILQRKTNSTTTTGSTDLVVNAKTLELPAGEVTMTGQVGFRTLEQAVSSREGEVVTDSTLSRDSWNGQISVDVPLLEQAKGIGDLSVNANLSVSDLSDFGTLTTWGGGFTWRPSDRLRLIGSYTKEEGAPSLGDLGNPIVVTPNARVFDFTTGDTVLVAATSGGNPDLLADTRDVTKLGVQLKPWDEREVTINVDYTQSLLEDEARDFPALTAQTEAAFPDRFTRDADGTLVAIDRRPVNFAEGTQRQIRTGINWSKRLERSGGGGRPEGAGGRHGGPPRGGRPSSPSQAEGNSDQPKEGETRKREPNRQPTRSGRPGRQFVSFYHTWVLEDSLVIRDSLPELDLLDGSAIGDNGGTSAHQLNLSYRRWNNGLGISSRLRWQSPTDVDGALTGGSDLEFSDPWIAEFRMSYDLGFSGAVMQRAPWLRDTRLSFDVENIFDQRIKVTDENGETPLRFQPDLIDPIGRTFEIEIRKRF